MIRPTLVPNAFAARREMERRQTTSTSNIFGITVPPVATPTSSGKGQLGGSVFQGPTNTNGPAPLFTFNPGAQASGAPFGNSRGGIDDKKDKAGLSKGGTAAIVVVFILLAITALVLTFLYRRGYFLKLQRRARSIKMQNRRPINRSEISYPVDDKGSLTRWASQPGVAAGPNQTKSVSAFVVQERHSADSLSNGPQWNTTPAQNLEGARRAAPLPPRPSARPQERESGALGTMDWRTMNPVTPTGPAPVPPPKQDPFADPENDIGSNGKHGKAFNELDEILAMERRQR